jgi:hypothetical protein
MEKMKSIVNERKNGFKKKSTEHESYDMDLDIMMKKFDEIKFMVKDDDDDTDSENSSFSENGPNELVNHIKEKVKLNPKFISVKEAKQSLIWIKDEKKVID